MRSAAAALVADLAAVLMFVVVGRGSHAESLDVVGVLGTAAPFLIGLGAGWLGGRVWRAPRRLVSGAAVWAGAVAVGLALRAGLTGQLPAAFALVSAVTLGVLLFGWRAALIGLRRARRRSA